MKISLSPQRRDDDLHVSKIGDVLTINGVKYDFSVVPDGALLPQDAIDCNWLASGVERVDGSLHLTLILPHGESASEAARFPAPIINPADGPLELPQ
jgi:hypothetical protein